MDNVTFYSAYKYDPPVLSLVFEIRSNKIVQYLTKEEYQKVQGLKHVLIPE